MITIKKDSLLGIIYNYWYLKAGKTLSENGIAAENFCHFCRVIFGWTFFRWFFCARTMKIVTPWLVTLIIAFITVFYLWPEKTKMILLALLIVIGCAAGFIGLLIGPVCICDKLNPNVNKLKKFLQQKVVGRLPVWFFILSALLALGLHFTFEFTVVLVIFYGAFSLLFLIIVNLPSNTPEKIMKIIPISLREILEFVWEYLKAKKQKICPPLQVELDERNKR